MNIELTPKEIYAISKSLTKTMRRTKFGTRGLSSKLYDLLEKSIPEEEFNELEIEWKNCAVQNQPKKTPKPLPLKGNSPPKGVEFY